MRDAALKEHFASLANRGRKSPRLRAKTRRKDMTTMTEEERQFGKVKWFKAGRGDGSRGSGYGFIEPSEGGPDCFIHISEVLRSGYNDLREGERVSYRLRTDPKHGKPCAVDLRLEPVI
jgi:cold shock protein